MTGIFREKEEGGDNKEKRKTQKITNEN